MHTTSVCARTMVHTVAMAVGSVEVKQVEERNCDAAEQWCRERMQVKRRHTSSGFSAWVGSTHSTLYNTVECLSSSLAITEEVKSESFLICYVIFSAAICLRCQHNCWLNTKPQELPDDLYILCAYSVVLGVVLATCRNLGSLRIWTGDSWVKIWEFSYEAVLVSCWDLWAEHLSGARNTADRVEYLVSRNVVVSRF